MKNSFSIQIYCQEVETKKVVAMEVGMKAQVHYYKKLLSGSLVICKT